MGKKIKVKSINEYIIEAKSDLLVYLIFYIIIIVIATIFSFYVRHWSPIAFSFILIFFVLGRITTYKNIKKIEKHLVDEKIINNIGRILFWNEQDYIITDNYFIIVNRKKVTHFRYNDITELYKKTNYNRGGFKEYLHIKLKNNKEYSVLIWTTFLVNEEYKDISKYLLEKNPNIKYKD